MDCVTGLPEVPKKRRRYLTTMHRNFLALILAFAFVALAALPATADPGIALLPQSVGQRIHYRVVRNTQGTTGPQSTTVVFDLVRRAGTTMVIERGDAAGTPNLSVLKTGTDGSLALAEDPRGAAADADLGDVLYGLNVAIAATHGADASARGAWAATVPVAPTPGAATAAITLVPANVAGSDFDFSGTGQATASAPPQQRAPGRGGTSGGGGAFPGRGGGRQGGGGGYPGASGGLPGGGGGDLPGSAANPGSGTHGDAGGRAAPGNNGGVSIVVHVAGHVSGGQVNQVAITQTRSITVAYMPFVNVGSWSITVVK